MAKSILLKVGIQNTADGTDIPSRGGRQGDQIVSELHGRFYEQTLRGNVYSAGMTTTSINAATFTTATLGATGTPILGVWNPVTSPVNLVILQAIMVITVTAATNTGCGTFQWCSSVNNSAITTGATPWNRKTLSQAGSFAKNMAGLAMTGQTNPLVVMHAACLGGGSGGNFSFVGTAAGQFTVQDVSVENVDGGLIVPPGGLLAVLCTTTPVAHSATSALIWEEVLV